MKKWQTEAQIERTKCFNNFNKIWIQQLFNMLNLQKGEEIENDSLIWQPWNHFTTQSNKKKFHLPTAAVITFQWGAHKVFRECTCAHMICCCHRENNLFALLFSRTLLHQTHGMFITPDLLSTYNRNLINKAKSFGDLSFVYFPLSVESVE